MTCGYIDSLNTVTLTFNGSVQTPFNLKSSTSTVPLELTEDKNGSYSFTSTESIALNQQWWLECGDRYFPVKTGKVVRTAEFERLYAKKHDHYGAVYSPDRTTFTVWSPVAHQIILHLDDEQHVMTYCDGDWSITLSGDHHLATYYYEVHVNHEEYKVIDPYTKGLTLNSTAGVVIDTDVAPAGFSHHTRPVHAPADSIIYEVHVRDFSMHPNSGIPDELKGKFTALSLAGTTTHNGYSTGFDYIRSLGVTHVELLPVNDFAKVDDIHFRKSYNWGYDPMYFQTLDGSYSTAPEAPESRIIELKSVIQHYHEAGIGMILDVVFNHVFDQPTSSFEQLVPGYYFRYYDDLSLSNGTGVGNDFASERLMGRKFILDTLLYYAEYFQVDGFRFDLMGAIDTETMRQAEVMLTALHPDILLLGEGWHLNTAIPDDMKTTHDQSSKVPAIHFFNDHFRDSLKGNNFDIADTGYFNGRGRYQERIYQLFHGAYGLPVSQTINYTEVHDNHTLFDRLSYTSRDPRIVLKQHQMITLFTLLSQGIPFIHAGQEFYRTKYGHGNTYNLGDFINRIDWNRRIKYNDDIAIIRKAIQLKKEYEVFRLNDPSRIMEVPTVQPLLGVLLFDDHDEFIIYFNPTALNHTIEMPRQGVFKIELSNSHSSGQVKGSFLLAPYECIVLRKTTY
ncbi:type I pullulanase [Macrococcus carouselicus]|uniref:Type I pullulanase n=1 Tax=Macrococcus carouselicus TaxID=69969 RepID=A0A9Q8CME0_9STAP|nr:type I pullulanase [Macrococcus carouselicus]TDM03962.1 type I pullulanase [Macrococcus carouselicus]